MTRVALLGPTRHPVAEPYAGGQESHVATLARGLRGHGHHVVLYAAEGTDADLADELVVHERLPRLSSVAAGDPQLPEPSFLADQHAYLGVVGDLMARRGELDVVHNSSLHHLPLVASRAVDRPHVTTLHTPPFPWMETGVALADPRVRMVAVSDHLAGQWTSLTRPATVVPNGVDPTDFPRGAGGDGLAWVGRIVPDKGVDLAVAAARRAGRSLCIVGPVSDPEYYDAVVRPLLGADVQHAGHLDRTGVAEVVGAGAALLVTPRWEEPFGLVAVEAALTGTPCVALERGGLAAVARRCLGTVVRPGADDAQTARRLAQAVETVAGATDRDAVWAAAVEHFSVEAMTERYLDLYDEVIATW